MIPSFIMHCIPRKIVPIKGQIVLEPIFCLCALQAKRPIRTLPKQTNQRVPMTRTCVQTTSILIWKAVNSSQNIDGMRNNKYATKSLTQRLLYFMDIRVKVTKFQRFDFFSSNWKLSKSDRSFGNNLISLYTEQNGRILNWIQDALCMYTLF